MLKSAEQRGHSLRKFNKASYFLFLLSLFLVTKTLRPLAPLVEFAFFQNPLLPLIPYDDSIYYLSQIRAALDGNRFFGNSIFFENHLNTSKPSYGNSSLFVIWGILGRILSLDLLQVYLVMIMVNTILVVIGSYYLCRTFTTKFVSISITFILCIYLPPLGRPSPTQQLLGLLLIGFALYFKSSGVNVSFEPKRGTVFFWSFTLVYVLLLSGNPLYAVTLVATMLTYEVVSAKSVRNKFSLSKETLFACGLTLIYYSYFTFGLDNLDREMATRFGLLETRIPGAIKLTAGVLTVAILSGGFLSKSKVVRNSVDLRISTGIVFSLNISLLFLLNSQVITGTSFEMESHFKYVVPVLNLVFVALVLVRLMSLYISRGLKKSGFLLFTSLLLITGSMQLRMATANELDFVTPAEYLPIVNQVEDDQTVVLIDRENSPKYGSVVIYLTQGKLYWHSTIALSRARDAEIIHRFACASPQDLSKKKFVKQESELFFHEYINEYQKLKRLSKLFPYFKSQLIQHERAKAKKFERAFKVFESEVVNCKNGIYRYKVDKILEINEVRDQRPRLSKRS